MGAAGDMLMAALYELLEDQDALLKTMNALGLPKIGFHAEGAITCGIKGTRMRMSTDMGEEESTDVPKGHGGHIHRHETINHAHDDHSEHHSHHEQQGKHVHIHLSDVKNIIEALPLPQVVIHDAVSVYERLADAESCVHGQSVEQIHFHEVGTLDAIGDVVGVCYAIHLLNVEQIAVSSVHVGSGQVQCAHGILPVPSPATERLLRGIPVYGGVISGELCTPTGAALLSHFADSYGPMPAMTVEKTGYGIGKKEFPVANCVRAFLGEVQGERTCQTVGRITELCCNIDDMTPESLGYATQALLDSGALEVYTTPIQMKKGRPGILLTVLCRPDCRRDVVEQIFRHTTTNGLRVKDCDKYFLAPGQDSVTVDGYTIRVKTASGHGVSRKKPEYDDVACAAKESGRSFGDIWELAFLEIKDMEKTQVQRRGNLQLHLRS